MRKRFVTLAVTLVSVAATLMPYTAVADLLQSAVLTCNDGATLNLTLDTLTLSALTSALAAMSVDPAGDPPLACTLNSPTTALPTDTNPHYDSIVGGGRQTLTTSPFVCAPYSFSIAAHVLEGAPGVTASGQFNRTQPPNTLPTCAFPDTVSQLRVDIDCLQVVGSTANLSGLVTKSTGFFATAGGLNGGPLTVGTRVGIIAIDNPDSIAYNPASPPPGATCGQAVPSPISAGSITIED